MANRTPNHVRKKEAFANKDVFLKRHERDWQEVSDIVSPHWKILLLVLVSSGVIAAYYAGNSHSEVAWAGFSAYFFTMLILYGGWKAWTALSGKKEVSYSPAWIIGATVAHLAVLTGFFPFAQGYAWASFSLFFKIVGFLILPILIVLVTSGFGFWAMKRLFADFDNRSTEFRVVTGMTLGLASYLFFLSISTSVFGYSLATVFVPLGAMFAIGWKESLHAVRGLLKPVFRYENHTTDEGVAKLVALPLLSTELLFLVLTFLIGVNFVNVVRPMPIGWDDLGVYMNYPRIMAETGEIERLGIVAWQTLTGIGFLFRSATQAFFLNQIGGILSIVTIGLFLKRIISFPDSKKSYLNLPLLFATLVYAMPMIIFQQAKDMKLDPGLLAITTGAIFVIYELVRAKKEDRSEFWKLAALAGFLAGIAFAIKFTTLMLFLGAAATIAYIGLGLPGFYGFFGLFVGSFTALNLWGMLNVNYPKDDPALLSAVTFVSFASAAALFGYAFWKRGKTTVSTVVVPLAVFAVAAAAAFSPWMAKNVFETQRYEAPVNVGTILNGVLFPLPADVRSVRTESELEAIDKANADMAMSASGKTTNEDLWRYFGYENGINNYLKLPFNLTYQRNQPGEYTEITFVFLALLPAVFVFLAYRHPAFALAPVAVIIFEFFYFFNPWGSTGLTRFFSDMLLPGGYLVIAAVTLIPLLGFHLALEKNNAHNERFLANLAFLCFYGFVFVIAAYGIVWYGIAIYVLLLAAIVLSLERAVCESEGKSDGAGFATALVVFVIVMTYFFQSAVPHGWKNFQSASFSDYKASKLSQEEAIFASHPDYLPALATLNLKDPATLVDRVVESVSDSATKSILLENLDNEKDVDKLQQILDQMVTTSPESLVGVPPERIRTMNSEAKKARILLFEGVLYPKAEDRNRETIYRIGTFLTYFISENRKRYLEDSLVQSFGNYLHDENPDVTVERLKRLGVKYFLIDLNAATIDRDPRRDLTQRFENLLKTFRSDQLRLVKTDSLCLKSAMYSAKETTDEAFLTLAGVNYESYSSTGAVTYRTQKQAACHKYFAELIKGGHVTNDQHSYLLPLAKYVERKKPKTDEDLIKTIASVANHGWMALFEIK